MMLASAGRYWPPFAADWAALGLRLARVVRGSSAL